MLAVRDPITININEPSVKIYKVIVVGDSNVGKTSLTYRFCEGQFLESPEATIGVDFRERVLSIDGQEIKLQLWDTAGQERFRKSMVQHYYRNVHAVIFVYDVSNTASFDSLKQWIEEVDRHSFNDIPRILVGNKCDVRNAVNTNVAQKFADLHNMPGSSIALAGLEPASLEIATSTVWEGYVAGLKIKDNVSCFFLFETSARLDAQCDNVEAIFLTLAHKLKNQKPMIPRPIASIAISSGDNRIPQSSWCC